MPKSGNEFNKIAPSQNPHSRVWRLAAPIILANLSVPLLGAVDTAVMGHLPEPVFLGAVAIGTVIFHFLYWSFGFLRMGTTGLVAQAYGANNEREIASLFLRSAALAAGFGIAIWILQWPIIHFALILFEASPRVEGLAGVYFDIRVWSAPAVLINYTVMGWLIGRQNTKGALALQVWMNGVNILLDLLFVIGLGMDVAGVAVATVIAEYSAAIIGLFYFARTLPANFIWPRLDELLARDQLRRMAAINIDIFIRTFCLIFAFSFFTAQTAKFGDDLLAANAVLIQFQHFLSFGLDGFAHAAEALVGSALGSKNRDHLRSAVLTASLWALVIAGIYTFVYAVAGIFIIETLTGLPDIRAAAASFLPWLIISPIISVWSFMLDGVFIGATRTKEMRNGMILSLAVFLLAVFVLKAPFGNHGLWAALMIFMVFRAVTLGVYYPRIERSADKS